MSDFMGQARAKLPWIAETAVQRARLTVVPRRRRRAARLPFAILVGLVLLGGVLGLLMFNTSMQQVSFTATSLEARARALNAEEQALRMQLEQLRDPQQVASRAQELGMVPVVNPAFLRLSDGKTLGNPVPAAPTDGQRITPLPARKPVSFSPPPEVVPWDHGAPILPESSAGATKKRQPADR